MLKIKNIDKFMVLNLIIVGPPSANNRGGCLADWSLALGIYFRKEVK
jgi:hypothetical protein